jgi:hypothetical protein
MKLLDACATNRKKPMIKFMSILLILKKIKQKRLVLIKTPTVWENRVITCIAHLEKSIKSVLVISPVMYLEPQLLKKY